MTFYTHGARGEKQAHTGGLPQNSTRPRGGIYEPTFRPISGKQMANTLFLCVAKIRVSA